LADSKTPDSAGFGFDQSHGDTKDTSDKNIDENWRKEIQCQQNQIILNKKVLTVALLVFLILKFLLLLLFFVLF
jgi:hypothetical protein